MLNISNNNIRGMVDLSKFKSGEFILNKKYYKFFNKILLASLIVFIVIMFLPWTQNVTGTGFVTTLTPDQRPQTIQSALPGKIEEWFVREGDFVEKGDTILRISEIKSEYFDDKLLERTGSQIQDKKFSVEAYESKANALSNQMAALKTEQKLKTQQAMNKLTQARLKVQSDSIDLEAAKTNKQIALTQYHRAQNLQNEGLKATKDVEATKLKLRETEAKLFSQENKLIESKNKVINASLEISRIDAEYSDKLNKTHSDFYSAKSNQYEESVNVSKLENSYSNYEKRKGLMYLTAPQSGYVNKALRGGIGETFKEGESIIKIMPSNYDIAVEVYLRPLDMPLIHIGERVRVQFDGWPAIVFSGWESVSYGTYGARVVAIENYISDNGKYRVLLAPDKDDHKWPHGIQIGSGVRAIALLNDVPIWYETWRQLNGFPPNFYKPVDKTTTQK